jgi:CelD/BcsL family acetyltransferase involved in cellulose biosynthesis
MEKRNRRGSQEPETRGRKAATDGGGSNSATLAACRDMEEAKEIWGAIEAQQPAWDLNATWMSFDAWVSHFMTGETPVLKIMVNGRSAGLFPSSITRRSVAGVNFRVLGPAGNQHWETGYPIIGSEPEAAVRALISALAARRDWDVLEIGPMVSDCPLAPLLTAAGKEADLVPMICHQEDDWRVRISGTWEEFYKGRSANLRKTVARGERRLSALGEVTFEVFTGGSELQERVAEFCEVEGSGWKGRGRTAIRSDQAALGFHVTLMRSAAERGQLRLYILRLNGRPVAGLEQVGYREEAFGIKMGRDESLDQCAPGHIVIKRVLEHLFQTREAQTFDMMISGGTHGAYKARWGTEKRKYVTLRFFNPKTARGVLARSWFSMQPFLAALRGKADRESG